MPQYPSKEELKELEELVERERNYIDQFSNGDDNQTVWVIRP